MPNIDYLISAVIGHTLGIFYGFMICCSLFIRFLKQPAKFISELMINKKRTQPQCLNDPKLGTHGIVHLKNVKLHYVANGQTDKPLMLLLHGFPDFWFSWRYQLQEFGKDYRVVAVDLRGYNDSDKPSGYKNYFIQHIIQDIKELIPALGYKSCVLVGHDWGGGLAWALTGVYPGLVDACIVMNAPHPIQFRKRIQSNMKQFLASWYIFFFQCPWLPEFLYSFNDFEYLERTLKGPERPHVTPITESIIDAYKYSFSQKGFTGPINYYRASTKNLAGQMSNTKPPNITCPVLLVWGCQDRALTKENAERCADIVPHVEIKYIEEASHWVHTDTPQQVNTIMRDFLAKHFS